MKKFISMFLAMLMLASLITLPTLAEQEFVFPDETWDADANGVYLIADPADLLAFSVSAQMNGYYAGKTVKLTADIDMTNIEWLPVVDFKGTFDGDGHAIKGVTLAGQDGRLGFFNKITDATIQNVRFLDFNISLASTGAKGVAVISALANNQCLIKNVYTSGVVATAGTCAAGMVGTVNTQQGVLKIENSVSAVKCVGQRAGGFVAQVQPGTTVELTDCAFIGDLSEAGKYSSGITGLTVGTVKLTRCVALGNTATDKTTDIGSLVFIDHQNQALALDGKFEITIEDCYAATADDFFAIGIKTSRAYPYVLTIKNGGQTVYHHASTEEATLNAARDAIEVVTKYIAKGATVNVTKDNFATECAALTGWVATDDTVEYAAGKSVNVFVPASVKELMDKPFVEPAPVETEPVETQPTETQPNETQPTETQPVETQPVETTPDNSDVDTQAPDTQTPDTEAPKKGCSGTIGMSALAVVALAGGAMMIARKKKED